MSNKRIKTFIAAFGVLLALVAYAANEKAPFTTTSIGVDALTDRAGTGSPSFANGISTGGDLTVTKDSAETRILIESTTSGDAKLEIETAGGGSDSSYIHFNTNNSYTMGIDDTDSDKFKIRWATSTIEAGTEYLVIETDGDFFIPNGDLNVGRAVLASTTPQVLMNDTDGVYDDMLVMQNAGSSYGKIGTTSANEGGLSIVGGTGRGIGIIVDNTSTVLWADATNDDVELKVPTNGVCDSDVTGGNICSQNGITYASPANTCTSGTVVGSAGRVARVGDTFYASGYISNTNCLAGQHIQLTMPSFISTFANTSVGQGTWACSNNGIAGRIFPLTTGNGRTIQIQFENSAVANTCELYWTFIGNADGT